MEYYKALGPSYKLPKYYMAFCLSYNLPKNKNKDKAQVYLFKRTKFVGQVTEWEGVRHPFHPDRVWSLDSHDQYTIYA